MEKSSMAQKAKKENSAAYMEKDTKNQPLDIGGNLIIATNEIPTIAFYCRSAVKDDRKIEEQVKCFTRYASKHSIVNYKTYIDNGYSGASILNRAAFLELALDIQSGQIKTVIVVDNHRLSRSRNCAIEIERFFIGNNIEHIEVNQREKFLLSDVKSCVVDKNELLAALNLWDIKLEPRE